MLPYHRGKEIQKSKDIIRQYPLIQKKAMDVEKGRTKTFITKKKKKKTHSINKSLER